MNYKKISFLNSTNRPSSKLISRLKKMTDRLASKRQKESRVLDPRKILRVFLFDDTSK